MTDHGHDAQQYNKTEVEKEVIKIIEQRDLAGRQTYGQGLEYTDDYDWLDMAMVKIS